MRKEIEITASTVRVDKISLDQFMSDLREILSEDPELAQINVTSVVFAVPGGSMNLGRASPDAFNISTSVPPILEKLTTAMKKHYGIKQGT